MCVRLRAAVGRRAAARAVFCLSPAQFIKSARKSTCCGVSLTCLLRSEINSIRFLLAFSERSMASNFRLGVELRCGSKRARSPPRAPPPTPHAVLPATRMDLDLDSDLLDLGAVHPSGEFGETARGSMLLDVSEASAAAVAPTSAASFAVLSLMVDVRHHHIPIASPGSANAASAVSFAPWLPRTSACPATTPALTA